MPRWLRATLRWSLRLLVAGLLGAAGIVAAACAYLSTDHGRTRLLRTVVAELDRVLPGTVEARELSQLTPTAVVLHGLRLRARGGNEVVTLETARARIAPWQLLHGRVVVEAIDVVDAMVDLRSIDDPRLGLLSAVVEPSSDTEPEASGSTPLIVFGDVRLENCRVSLPSGFDAGPDEAWITSLRGRLSIGSELSIEVSQLRARARRRAADIGGVRGNGELQTQGRSRLELAGTLYGVGIDVDVALGEAGRPLSSWEHAPLSLDLALDGVTSSRLAALTGTSPPLHGTFGTRLSLHGTPLAFEADGTLETPGGPVSIGGRGRDLSRLEWRAKTEQLLLRELAEGLPARSVSAELSGVLEPLDPAQPGVRATLEASTRVDDVALPRLAARAEHAPGSPWRLAVALDDRWLALAGDGELSTDGALQANVRGWVAPKPGVERVRALGLGATPPAALAPTTDADRVEVRASVSRSATGSLDASATLGSSRLALGMGRVEKLGATLSLSGQLPRPRLRLQAAWQAALADDATLTPGRLELDGGPNRYRIDLHGGAKGALHASGWLEREGRGQRFAFTAAGQHDGAPWRIDVRPARLSDAGRLEVPGVDIVVDQQRIHAHGQYAGSASQLVLQLDDVDLRRALEPFFPGSGLAGVVAGRVEARGALPRPVLSLSLRAARVAFAGAPALDASIEGTLDLQSGSAALEARAKEHRTSASAPRLDVHLTGNGRFDPRRSWPALLSTGEQDVEVDLARLDSSLLDELIGSAPAGFDGRGHAKLHVAGGVPTLDYSVEGRLAWEGQPGAGAEARPTALLKHRLSDDGRRLHTELSLDDAHGRWLSFDGEAGLGPAPPGLVALSAASTEDWARWLGTASWRVALDAAPRAVALLPRIAQLPELGPATLGLRVAARREPGTDPVGSLSFQLANAARASKYRGCASRLLTTHGHLALGGSRFGAAVESYQGHERLLRAATGGKLDLVGWLGGERPDWSALEIGVEATHVPLDGLPFVCGRLRGALTGSGTLRDPLGTPQLNADLAIDGFSLGSDQTVDVDAKVSVDPSRLELSGEVNAEGHRSPLSIRWQAADADSPRGGAVPTREISVELVQLPLAPLLPLEGPISHVSGYVGGQLTASAGGGSRALTGTLRFEQVALTVTELAQPLSDISGEIGFEDGAIAVRRLTARDGDGELTLDGDLKLYGSRSFDGDFQLVTRKFPLRQAGDVVALTTATARIEAGWRPELHRLHVALQDFDTWLEKNESTRGLSLEPHPDVTVKARPNARSQPAAEAEPASTGTGARTPLVVEIDAAQPFWVKRADFALKLSASLKVATAGAKSKDDASPVDVTGQLSFERGYMEMLGKSFEVKRGGMLRFTGGTSAVLDLSAQYEDRRTDKLVLVRLTGSAEAPKLEFQVDGRKVNAGEAFQAIYGSDATSDDVDPEAQASQIIGALMAGVLTTSMRKKLGAMAPILSVDPADEDRGEQLRAGFELDALIPDFLRDIVTGVYVEGSISSEKQADQAGDKNVQTGVLIELHFPYNLVSSGRYGPDTTWSLDLGWQP